MFQTRSSWATKTWLNSTAALGHQHIALEMPFRASPQQGTELGKEHKMLKNACFFFFPEELSETSNRAKNIFTHYPVTIKSWMALRTQVTLCRLEMKNQWWNNLLSL